MIDDTNPGFRNKKRPVKSVSFADLELIGINVYVTEFEKKKPNGKLDIAVKVVKVTKKVDGVEHEVDRDFIRDTLWHLGVDTYDPNLKYWVTKKTKHRTVFGSNEPVYHYRFMGYERGDDFYIKSGKASEEAIMYSSNLTDMMDVAERMKNGGDV